MKRNNIIYHLRVRACSCQHGKVRGNGYTTWHKGTWRSQVVWFVHINSLASSSMTFPYPPSSQHHHLCTWRHVVSFLSYLGLTPYVWSSSTSLCWLLLSLFLPLLSFASLSVLSSFNCFSTFLQIERPLKKVKNGIIEV